MNQTQRDIEPPSLPAGQCTDLSSAQIGEFEITQQLVGPDLRVTLGHSVAQSLRHQLVANPLVMAGAVPLTDVSEAGAHFVSRRSDVEACDPRTSGRGLEQGGQHAQRRRFSGAVRSQQGNQLTLRDVEGDPLDGFHELLTLGEVLGERLRLDHRSVVSATHDVAPISSRLVGCGPT